MSDPNAPTSQPSDATTQPMMGGSTGDDDVTGVDPRNASDEAPSDHAPRQTAFARKVGKIVIGSAAPELTATKLETSSGGTGGGGMAGPLRLAALKNRPTLLVFGSYSSPVFRAKAPEIERLKTKYGSTVGIWLIYTREANAAGVWDVDRNRDAKIHIEQPDTLAARVTQAQQARKELKLTVLMAVDDLADGTAVAYGLTPNGAVLVDKSGSIAAAQQFFDSYGLEPAVVALIRAGGQMQGPTSRP